MFLIDTIRPIRDDQNGTSSRGRIVRGRIVPKPNVISRSIILWHVVMRTFRPQTIRPRTVRPGSTTAAIIAILHTVSDLRNNNAYVTIIALDVFREWDRQSMTLTRPTFTLLIQKITFSNLRMTLTSSLELACGPHFRRSLMVSLIGPPTTI